MIDNFELVKQLISFNEEDKLFFFLQIVNDGMLCRQFC